MEAQSTVGPRQKKRVIFPQWVRYLVLTIMVIAILACGVVWLKQVWGHLSDTFAALFGIGGLLVGLLALPFFYSSHESEASANAGPTPQFQNNNTIHIHLSNNHESSSTENRTSAPFSVSVDDEKQSQSSRSDQYTATSSISGTHPPAGTLEKPANKFKNVSRGSKLQLSGRERSELRDILFQAFPDPTEFDDMLQINFNERLNGLVNVNQNYKQILFDLLGKTQAEGWTEALIKAAYDSNLGNEMLANYYLTYVQNRKAQPVVETGGEAKQTMPENLNEKRGSSDITLKIPGEQLPDTRRGCVVDAQEHAKSAYDLVDPKMNILPEDIEHAARLLGTVKEDVERLRKLLRAYPPLPAQGSIIDQIDIISYQIDTNITPHLKPSRSSDRDLQRRFEPLLNALNKLDMLVPG